MSARESLLSRKLPRDERDRLNRTRPPTAAAGGLVVREERQVLRGRKMATFWTITIGAFASLLAAAIGAWMQYRFSNPKREFQFTVVKNDSLLNTGTSDPELSVMSGSSPLVKPRIIDLHFKYRGKKSFVADSFHNGDPITFDLDAQIVRKISQANGPETTVEPRTDCTGSKFLIYPSIWRPDQYLDVRILVDGEAQQLDLRAPLADVGVVRIDALDDAARHRRAMRVQRRAVFALALVAAISSIIAFAYILRYKGAEDGLDQEYLHRGELCRVLERDGSQQIWRSEKDNVFVQGVC